MSYIIPFNQLNINDVKLAGGKAISLAHMQQNGIPVPSGFVITTDAFTTFHNKELSDMFKNELVERFNELGSTFVAVRSSAIAEDAGDASWAGQLESYLNVTEDDLFVRVQECWESIKSSHAVDYAKDKNVSEEDMRVAVVVQSMIQSDESGVMFTADPISKDSNRIIIEGIYGLGEMIVQGITTPDMYVVSKDPFAVTEFSIQIKKKQMVYSNGVNQVIDVAEVKTDRAVLRENEVEELAMIGVRTEKLYGKAQDIEWARENNKFYIVQSRPITTL